NTDINNLYTGTLFMHPTDPNILLAGTGNNQYYDGNGVYLSSMAGKRGSKPWPATTSPRLNSRWPIPTLSMRAASI
ncbi:MAG: hypothetical protein GYB65_01820, partial [Chloroflexi bacterium]|nr:hypothetical protein [Chloroflexota bacterium]